MFNNLVTKNNSLNFSCRNETGPRPSQQCHMQTRREVLFEMSKPTKTVGKVANLFPTPDGRRLRAVPAPSLLRLPAAISIPPPMAAAAGNGDAHALLPSTVDIDENGFPALPSSPAFGSSFAAGFYRSGTDWSSLRAPPFPTLETASAVKEKGGGSLIQKSLFQAWGIKRTPREGVGTGDSPLVQRSLFQAWGIEKRRVDVVGAADSAASPSHSGSWLGRKRRRGGLEESGEVKKPLACPFYKKIPGKDRIFS
jgi:hypothetical protein